MLRAAHRRRPRGWLSRRATIAQSIVGVTAESEGSLGYTGPAHDFVDSRRNLVENEFLASTTLATGFGSGEFNVPPLYEAADTAPFFHNGAVSTLEDSIAFYQSPTFLASPGATFATPQLNAQSILDIGGLLRTVNALVNMAQVRARAAYLETNATGGGTTILKVALRDIQDAIDDLTTSELTGPATASALNELGLVKQALLNSQSTANSMPATHMMHALNHLALAKGYLLRGNPSGYF